MATRKLKIDIEAHLPEGMTIISKSHLDSLVEDSAKLNALEAMGVDNWSGYDEAMRMMEEWQNG